MNPKNLFKLRNLPYLVMLAGLFLFLGSCTTYKKCASKFAWKSDTIKTVVYRDTIIPVLIHGTDTVYRKAVITDTILVSSGNAHAKVYTIHDTTRVIMWQADTTIYVHKDSLIKVETYFNKQLAVKTEEGKGVKFLSKLFGCLLVIAVIALIIVVVPRFWKKK